MKIFLAYGYNSRDEWISEMVVPLIEAFGSVVSAQPFLTNCYSTAVSSNNLPSLKRPTLSCFASIKSECP